MHCTSVPSLFVWTAPLDPFAPPSDGFVSFPFLSFSFLKFYFILFSIHLFFSTLPFFFLLHSKAWEQGGIQLGFTPNNLKIRPGIEGRSTPHGHSEDRNVIIRLPLEGKVRTLDMAPEWHTIKKDSNVAPRCFSLWQLTRN